MRGIAVGSGANRRGLINPTSGFTLWLAVAGFASVGVVGPKRIL